jgi:hypothetical protein
MCVVPAASSDDSRFSKEDDLIFPNTVGGYAMTMDLYGHLFKSDDHKRAMDDIVGALFS